ncbi:4-phosphopantetheinyl transferase [Pseudoxanthomonas broegbernensis]|uniref:4-phosphopantetheinyl transferase n=1 Tax=Pseudoxanthomonas broegbernensis TaxID=83619 RepID=A0A7V8GL97_9GAMM|nr:4'-phosphopantetheinyl transferase superfamily protein [Pseudoxanthomonas broegbernensis]KAF1685683.1 4-phosphopantetheinyl transferase [Pseudoxanthomonas broegbernensis]MBB6066026.1 4'-phosphopantetheinyl transferase [Pseudoxanthomonas broegbernensis]
MSDVQAPGAWRFGPVRVQALPHVPGRRGEPQARGVLAGWLGQDADALPLVRDDHGRPHLRAPFDDRDAGWSHSGERLLLALGRGVTLGVDLERLRPRPRALELAERFFAPAEAERLQALAPERREPAFLRLWCAKEALLKAHGRGLAFGLHRLEFGNTDDRDHAPLRLLACDPELGDPAHWQLREWIPQPGYLAALAWRPR